MASFSERIKIVIDVATGNSPGAIKDLRSEINETEGTLGKFKVGGAAAMDAVKGAALGLAAGAGAALVAFAAKGVSEFQNLALAAGKFSEATGISTEAASRWIEVAGDVGVEASTVSGALLKMEKAAASNPEAFDAMGVSIARTADGSVDANETFIRTLETLGKIKDPAERAAAGTKVLGKSWAEMAEIIESGDIRGALESVSNAKVIDPAEVERARKFRDTMDQLRGTIEDLSLAVGEALVPALTDAAEAVSAFGPAVGDAMPKVNRLLDETIGATDNLASGWKHMTGEGEGALTRLGGALEIVSGIIPVVGEDVQEFMADDLEPMTEAAYVAAETFEGRLLDASMKAAKGIDKLGDSARKTKAEAKVLEDQFDALLDTFDAETSMLELEQGFDDLRVELMETAASVAAGESTMEEAMRSSRLAILAKKEEIANYVKGLGGIPSHKLTEINAALDNGDLDRAEMLLAQVTRDRVAQVRVQVNPVGDVVGQRTGARAQGGPVLKGAPYRVGEGNKPELLETDDALYMIPGDDGRVISNADIGQSTAPMMLGVGGTPSGGAVVHQHHYNITIQAGVVAHDVDRAVLEAMRRAEKRFGGSL